MQKKSETSKECDGTYYILHNCVHCVYVCLLSEPEKEISVRQEWLETVLTREKVDP